MGDITYRLIVDLSSRGSLSKDLEKVGKERSSLERLGDAARTVGSSVGGMFEGAVEKAAGLAVGLAKLGAGAGVAAMTYGVAGLNAELEKTTVSLAAVFNAQGIAGGMEHGMRMASGVIKEMRKDAAQLPGEFEDLLAFFRLGAAPGFNAGADVKRLEKMSANAMATAAATGMDMGQASREFAQLLQGRSGAHNVFGSLIGITGEASKKFNAATGEERLKTLEKEFGKYEASIKTFSTTFDALKSTMVDNLKNVTRETTAPLFERVKTTLGEANAWFDANGDRVENMSERVGKALAYAFDVGKEKILAWGPLIFDFAVKAGERIEGVWARVEPYANALEGKAKAFMRHGGSDVLLDKIGDAGKLYGALQLAKFGGPALGMVGEAGAAAMGAGPAGWAAIAAAAAALVSVGGAIHALTDETSAYHEKAVMIAESIKTHFGGVYDSLGSTFTKLSPELTTIADIMGTELLRGVQMLAVELDAFAKILDAAASTFVAAKVALGGQGLQKINEAIEPARQPFEVAPSKLGLMALDSFAKAEEAAKKTDKKSVHGHGGTNIQKVEIVVSSNQDPSRIARLTAKELGDLARNPTASRHVKNWSAAQP